MRTRLFVALAIAALSFAQPSSVFAQAAAPPTYSVQFLGTGSPVAINNAGTIAGARLNGSAYQPLVSRSGAPWVPLPMPAGADSALATDVNDSGVIVGVAFTAFVPAAVRWRPSGSGYTVDVLPRLPGDAGSYATGINDLGQIVGTRGALGYVPTGGGWVYSEALGVVGLAATYGLFTTPYDINDLGQIASGLERLTLSTGVVDTFGAAPAGYQGVNATYLNDAGQAAGTGPTTSQSLPIVSAFRFDGPSGWRFIAGTSRYTAVFDLNERGDVVYSELGTGIYFDGLGAFALGGLLAPDAAAAGWVLTGSGAKINDDRVVVALGRNAVTGQTGAVLLTPSGSLQPPAAPMLTAVPHPSVPSAPWNAISLSWTVSAGATSYAVERRGPGDVAFVTLTGSTIQTIYDDTAVQPGATYTYRVFALGAGGRSAASNEATAVAPQAADTTAPVVSIASPTAGARVSGVVRVRASATDATGVVRMVVLSPGGTVLGTSTGGQIACDWNTAGLRRGSTQTLTVRAYDAAGNQGTRAVSVRIR
jgi:hypothetical protein